MEFFVLLLFRMIKEQDFFAQELHSEKKNENKHRLCHRKIFAKKTQSTPGGLTVVG